MSKYFLVLQTVNDTVNDFTLKSVNLLSMKKNYSEPKISTGGIKISEWNKLSSKQKKEALEKDWFVYYSFRSKIDGKLKRMPFVKAGANRFKTKEERYEYLKTLKDALEYLLKKGLNPYEDNDPNLIENILKETGTPVQVEKSKEIPVIESQTTNELSIKEATDFVLRMKSKTLAKNIYKNYENRIRKFTSLFNEKIPISKIDKKAINDYLNDTLLKNSARTRNNHRTDLSTFFQTLEDNDIISNNFVKKIPVLKTKAEKNKTYTPTQEKDIFDYCKSSAKSGLI